MRGLQRCLDVVVAGAALFVLSPLLLTLGVWLRAAGTRRVLYGEERLGRGGRRFRLHKFRTLREGSAVEPTVAVPGDPRITGPGRFLRHWRLDELPQLWNVLVGEMSLVGPRPQLPAHFAAIDPAALQRLLRVRPGITGPAAVEFLGEDEALAGVEDPVGVYRRVLLPAKVRLELDYLEHWSPARDLAVGLRTLTQLLSARARRESRARARELIAAAAALECD